MTTTHEMRRVGLAARLEPALFALVAGGVTLAIACIFYSSIRLQTHFGSLSLRPEGWDAAVSGALLGEWSAPLDDVFIHFDFARAAARGYPFQWSEGNGYSSGGTSLLYPSVLAFGYWIGFRQLHLMVWAGIVACVCVFATLLASRRMFGALPRWTSYLAPPIFLGVGALSWSLFSGMEVALLIAIWAGALIAWDDLLRVPEAGEVSRPQLGALVLGIWGALLVATRPEAATTVALFSLSAAAAFWKRRGAGAATRVLLLSALPGVAVLVVQAFANWALTGDTSAAGALAKLELHHPHLSGQQVWDAWKFHVGYQVMRVTHYHLSLVPGYGWALWALAVVPLATKKTRRYAALLWGSAALWILTVALNGQVRWQNERYTMPAVAWLLLAAALGVAVLLTHAYARGRRGTFFRAASIVVAVGAVGVLAWQQLPRYREQVWFFGRASRNIRDQHVLTGRLLRRINPRPSRVLVGDAGAIPYMADIPALDIIGLGGYRQMPFARATRWGIAGAIELIERIPPRERPDVLAIYPSWWGDMPLWFGDRVLDVPVRGNVICGGPTKVVYEPRWGPLDGSAQPFSTQPDEVVVDELDFADMVSEREHRYEISRPVTGFLAMKMLPHPGRPARDLWDGGRIIPPGVSETFELGGFTAGKPVRLVVRTAAPQPSRIDVIADGKPVATIDIEATDGWSEKSIDLGEVGDRIEIRLDAREHEHTLYHLWAVQPR